MSPLVASRPRQFPRGPNPIWAKGINCTEPSPVDFNEPGILYCKWNMPIRRVKGCTHQDDAGIICYHNTSSSVASNSH